MTSLRLCCAIGAAAISAVSASADTVFYGVSDVNLLRFNMTTQSVTIVGPLTKA